MKKIAINFSAFVFTLLTLSVPAFAKTDTYIIAGKDISEGFVVKKMWLTKYAMPTITLSGIAYADNANLPKNVKPADATQFQALLGMDRKRPFVVVRVPVFNNGVQPGTYKQLSSFDIDVTEQPTVDVKSTGKTTTDATTSVLATGTWYKIAVTQTGFYKLDYNFFTSLGINAATLNPANIRVYGNGGNMLSENNAVPRLKDLTENAIYVNDGGDNAFNSGDYAVFYAVGPTGWHKDSVNQRFTHVKNLYSDTAYYFINVDKGQGLRIQQQAAVPTPNVTASGFNYYDARENDLINPTSYGKSWYGEQFYTEAASNSQTFTFDLGDNISQLTCKVSMAATQQSPGSSFNVTLNGSTMGSVDFANVTLGDVLMTHAFPTFTSACNSSTASIGINFIPSPSDAASHGYLDYIEIFGRRPLSITGSQLSFRDWQTVGAGKIAGYTLASANSDTRIWDVTNPQVPVQMQGSLGSSGYSFAQDASYLHEFAAMNNSNLYTPKYIGTVNNQNLHGMGTADLIIVTYPGFIDAANKIGNYHHSHDNMRVAIATTTEVFNEFSSGSQDISAMRDFAKMFYDRAGTDSTKMPKYLMLLGSASYDYKNRLPNNCNLVPTFEAANDSSDLSSFLSDDFFGFLDDNENSENSNIINALDIGIGRIPARNATDAMIAANKIINYQSPATLGPWRTSAMFAADDNDGAGNHMDDAETMGTQVTQSGKNLYNLQKVYVNAIPVISTPAGTRCPNANAAINEQIFKGTFMVNYNGHGNPQVWTGERILTSDDVNNWNNANMLPFMTTATCDFGQYDHPQFVSLAEAIMLREGGGAIAMVTTTGAVFAGFNTPMNQHFIEAQFTKNPDGHWNTFGDACRIGKNSAYLISHSSDEMANYRKFVLLGDPALTPDFPKYNVVTDSVRDGATLAITDSIKALGKYIINGSIRDNNNQTLTGFNGTLTVSFYDKARSITVNCYDHTNRTFKLQDNLIYKGKVSVTNGLFSLTFITPKDINYFIGKGKISTYAENGDIDAAGADTTLSIGGFSSHPITNTEPPVVHAYINDSLFINGGITGTNTALFVSLHSVTGINVSGFSIGHNLTAVLDGNIEQPYVLNDYYETAPNTYQAGFVHFPITGLADGKHTINVKAWDVNNNSGEGSVDFEVVNGQVVAIENLGNYPNPFANSTHFVFEHNHPDEQMTAQVLVYNTAGMLVKTIKESFVAGNSRSTEITWDGSDNYGNPLPSGIYVYKLNIETDKGFKATAYQKLVIVR